MIAKYTATALLGTALISGAAFAQTATTPAAPDTAVSSTSTSMETNLKGNWRASKLVGLAVYNEANEKLGDISEVLVDKSGKVNAAIIGVGGFLGVGQHDIAVSFDKLKWVNEPVRAAATDRTPATPGAASPTARPATTTGAAGTSTSAPRDNWYPDHAVLSGTKDQLKAMPAFKYSDSN